MEPKRILIDPGHGGRKPGAVRKGVLEKDLNLSIALKVRDFLINMDAEVRMVRTSDVDIPLRTRVKIEKALRPECIVSIHCNAVKNPKVRGYEVLYCSDEGQELSEFLDMYIGGGNEELKSRGIKYNPPEPRSNRLMILHDTVSPAVIVECEFMSNSAGLKWLLNEENQDSMALGIARGINSYVNPVAEEPVNEEQEKEKEETSDGGNSD